MLREFNFQPEKYKVGDRVIRVMDGQMYFAGQTGTVVAIENMDLVVCLDGRKQDIVYWICLPDYVELLDVYNSELYQFLNKKDVD